MVQLVWQKGNLGMILDKEAVAGGRNNRRKPCGVHGRNFAFRENVFVLF